MKEYHILFTGVGRRVELIQAFREAASCLNKKIKIYGSDITEWAPALAFCDYTRIVCKMKEKNYISELLEICKKDKIDLIIPTIDTDLNSLSLNKNRFEEIKTRVLISEPEKILLCRDKNYTSDFFRSCKVKAPITINNYKKYVGRYPCFIKPKDGSSSINAFKVKDKNEIKLYADLIKDYVIQPYIEGMEYTVDIFCDFGGMPVYITPRVRLAVRAGEVLKTKIDLDERIINECKKIIEKFKPCGPITVQLIREINTGEDYYIEINPRYGGGVPLSMKAGARSAETVLKLLSGQEVGYLNSRISDKAVYSRFDQSICVKNNKSEIKGVIFDLDDTLYSEKEYVKSGYSAVSEYLGNRSYKDKLWDYFKQGEQAIEKLLQEIGREKEKEDCINIYRNHKPQITIYNGAMKLIQWLNQKNIKVGIITDGRPEGQKNKIHALGLDDKITDIIITDNLGGIQFRKPDNTAFRIMQKKWNISYESMIYIGDNIDKDYLAVRQLGIRFWWFRNRDGIYWNENLQCQDNTFDSISSLSEEIMKQII